MGAWGHEAFENDDALDLLGDLQEKNNINSLYEIIKQALQQKAEEGDDAYIEVDIASYIVSIGEIIALMRGHPHADLPEQLLEWHEKQSHATPTDQQVKQVIEALQLVRDTSELQELWEETDEFGVWQDSVDDVMKRLKTQL